MNGLHYLEDMQCQFAVGAVLLVFNRTDRHVRRADAATIAGMAESKGQVPPRAVRARSNLQRSAECVRIRPIE